MTEDNKNAYTDITVPRWLEPLPVPVVRRVMPYVSLMRLDRPIGTWLLLLPALWAIVMAAGGFMALTGREYGFMALFCIGAVVMRGAGCVVNDLWDREIDRKVERTASRPLASGAVSPRQALIFLAALLMLGLAVLLQLSPLAIGLGVLSLAFVAVYPLMKRWTWWPQLFLGFTFNFGALMGWAAVGNNLDWAALLLYAGGIFWTLGYDTIYAAQDVDDDALVGVRSTTRLFAENSRRYVGLFYAAAVVLWLVCGALWNAAPLFYAAMALVAAHFIWQVWRWDWRDRALSLRLFRSNRDLGLLMLFACGLVAL